MSLSTQLDVLYKNAFIKYQDESSCGTFEVLRRNVRLCFGHNSVLWVLHNCVQAGGTAQCMCRAVIRSTGQCIHRFQQNIVADNDDFKIYIDQIKFSQLVIRTISLMPISILSFSIFTSHPAALYPLSNKSATYFFCTVTHKTVYISN